MKNFLAKVSLVVLVLAPAVSEAARAWLLPSQTMLARSGGWVAVDAAMADDLFSVNQGAMQIDALTVTAPDGQLVTPQNPYKGRSRSSFDLELRQPGTYRIAVADSMIMARWEERTASPSAGVAPPRKWPRTSRRTQPSSKSSRCSVASKLSSPWARPAR